MGVALSTADIAVIAVSLLIVVAVGFWVSRKQEKTARGYFLASGRLPWYIVGSAFVATSISSEQMVGTVGAAYSHGMKITNWEWLSSPVFSLMIIFFIPIYMRNKISTVPEYLSRRFGPLCGDIYGWVMLAAYVLVFLVTVLYGGSLAFAGLTGFNFYYVLWATILFVALYTVKGGLKSVVWTDAVQCLMLIVGGVVLFFLALRHIPGGWSAMMEAHPERFHLYQPPSDPFAPFLGLVVGTFGVFIWYQAANQVMVQRVLGARTIWDGMMGIVFAGFIGLIRPLVTVFLGFIVYHWIHVMGKAEPLANADDTFAFALKNLAPGWGIRGVILAGFLAAVMSTISALSNSAATIFSLDIYRKLWNPNASEKRLVLVGRLASMASLCVAGVLAPLVKHFGGIFQFFQTGITYMATPVIAVVILGILWKRMNYQGALFGLVGGLLIQVAIAVGFPQFGFDWNWLYLGFIAEIIIMCGMAAVALATPPPPAEAVATLVWNPSFLKAYSEESPRPWYQNIWLWFGIFASVEVFLYWYFW